MKLMEFFIEHRLWVEILNKYFENIIEIKIGSPLAAFIINSENLNI